jgi:hypothetical protein
MKRSSKNDEPAKALQKLAQAPADSKGLQYAKIIESAPRKRRGNRIEVTSKKTREEFADELTGEIEKATGVPLEVASRIATQMTQAQVWPWSEGGTEALIKAVTTIAELGPRNAIQASLAVQMTATGEAALMFMHRATLPNQPSESVDLNVARARCLMHLHLKQIEAWQKLKGLTGQQKVTVEHVHVHEGGQAIVGAVSTTRGREGGNGDAGTNTP